MAKKRPASRALVIAAPIVALAGAGAALLRRMRGGAVLPVDDAELAERVREAVSRPEHVPGDAVSVSASAGVVTLAGDIGAPYTQATIDAAARAAGEVPGVRRVDNRLRLVGGSDAADAAVAT
jgi:hypothetical protein